MYKIFRLDRTHRPFRTIFMYIYRFFLSMRASRSLMCARTMNGFSSRPMWVRILFISIIYYCYFLFFFGLLAAQAFVSFIKLFWIQSTHENIMTTSGA